MTTWKKVAPELTALFDSCLPHGLGVERRQMFGCPAAFVNGNMFACTHETRLVVRQPFSRREPRPEILPNIAFVEAVHVGRDTSSGRGEIQPIRPGRHLHPLLRQAHGFIERDAATRDDHLPAFTAASQMMG